MKGFRPHSRHYRSWFPGIPAGYGREEVMVKCPDRGEKVPYSWCLRNNCGHFGYWAGKQELPLCKHEYDECKAEGYYDEDETNIASDYPDQMLESRPYEYPKDDEDQNGTI